MDTKERKVEKFEFKGDILSVKVKFTDYESMVMVADRLLHITLNDILYYSEEREKFKDGIFWLWSDEDSIADFNEVEFTINKVCKLLKLKKDKIRILINMYKDQGKKRLLETEYTKLLEMCSYG